MFQVILSRDQRYFKRLMLWRRNLGIHQPLLCISLLVGDKEVRGWREELGSVKSELNEVRENKMLKSQFE